MEKVKFFLIKLIGVLLAIPIFLGGGAIMVFGSEMRIPIMSVMVSLIGLGFVLTGLAGGIGSIRNPDVRGIRIWVRGAITMVMAMTPIFLLYYASAHA